MENDPLQQLRDVHLPPDPNWWPPAIGWWLLVIAILALVGWSIYQMLQAYRRRAPKRAAKSALSQLHAAFSAGGMSANEYLHQGNEILKRLLVRAYGRYEYASLAGDQWLSALDTISATDHFSNGPGRILGNERFKADPEVDVDGLNSELQMLINKVQP